MKFTLGNKTSDELDIILRNTPKPLQGGLDSSMINIAGKPGGYDFGADLKPLTFQLNCEFSGTSEANLQSKVRSLADHLFNDKGEPVTHQLSFSDEPDKFWRVRYGSKRGQLINRMVGGKVGRFKLILVAEDPLAHEVEEVDTKTITVDGGSIEIENSGNVETPVRMVITNTGDTTIDGFTIRREVS